MTKIFCVPGVSWKEGKSPNQGGIFNEENVTENFKINYEHDIWCFPCFLGKSFKDQINLS